jgi:hypothetical protein
MLERMWKVVNHAFLSENRTFILYINYITSGSTRQDQFLQVIEAGAPINERGYAMQHQPQLG